MSNLYQIHLVASPEERPNEEIVTVDKRKLSIRDGYVHANGCKIGENEQMSLIVPFNSIRYITEIVVPDDNSQPKKENENIKQWRFGQEPPKDLTPTG